MKPQELGAALKEIAESHATKRRLGDSNDKPVRELDYSSKGGMISLDAEGTSRIAKLTKALLDERPKMAESCVPETVRFELVEAVKRFVYSDTPLDPSKEAEQLIQRFTGGLCDFVFVFRVKGGRIATMMRLNRTIFVPSMPMISAALTSEFSNIVKFPAKDLDTIILRKDPTMPVPNLDKSSAPEDEWYVVSHSLALDEKKAEEKALHIAEEDIGLLRFTMLKDARVSGDTVSIEVMSDPFMSFKNGTCLGNRGAALGEVSCTMPLRLFDIPELLDFRVQYAEEDFQKIASVLNVEKRSKLQERVYLAYTWLNKALKQRDPRERLLDSIIGMEALMLQPHESRADTLAERVAFSLGQDFASRKKTFDRMRELVQMRNRVSHEGETNVVGEQADLSIRILGNLIEVMTTRCEKDSDITGLIKEVEVMKFS